VDWHGLLLRALGAQASGARGVAASFRVALCGAPLHHFATRPDVDDGFGCGWRNLQMLCGHLLLSSADGAERALRTRALFAGAGFVPDLPSLQAWLETAWAAGFDPAGRDHLGGAVQGKDTWIGACDAAALLRSFGLRAQIVDFKAPPAAPAAGTHAASDVRHPGVECDGCGAYPIVGPRFSSEARPNYDLCRRCQALPAAQQFQPYTRRDAPSHAAGGAPVERACEPGAHAALVDFMWSYFTSDGATGRPLPLQLGGQLVVSPLRPPLFLQHDGHSRTVVGVERRRRPAGVAGEDVFLLVFDPSTARGALRDALAAGQAGGWQRLVKRGLATLRKREYSVLVMQRGELAPAASPRAWEESKTLRAMDAADALLPGDGGGGGGAA